MRDNQKYFPVNWIDGMKINKDHFIAQDNAFRNALNDLASLSVSPIRYGVLPSSYEGENNFNVKIALDNQNVLRVSVLNCQAVTPGGIRISLPVLSGSGVTDTDGVPAVSFQFSDNGNNAVWWVTLTVHPYNRLPAGSPDLSENPPRFPYVIPAYSVQVVNESQYDQYANNPYSLIVGKLVANANDIRIDHDYIPPCYSTSAYPDLVSLHSELDQFFSTLETRCLAIVQNIFQKKQQNEISELVQFLCDRMMLYLSQAITEIRWTAIHESPAVLFSGIANLARVMKNAIDMRIGSGKEEMMNYLSEWSDMKQGELEALLVSLANIRYDNNDINKNIGRVTLFVKVTTRLFDTLSKLEFIGKRKTEVVKALTEDRFGFAEKQAVAVPPPPRRRFFG
ncbi:hypothetical protein QTN47_11590 [Danxiaibacter flavus]|uniref:Type VI secretion system baseplate subunit TssK n=1 Tax=Danxiaibacter flavus TaxID=3049108 RepID=A0ABV3ZI02_9BACT|nr:hypothetical protein QNM32_11595 [Chitinophagaceae bacterium DXS]